MGAADQRHLDQMHAAHGTAAHVCGDCGHCVRQQRPHASRGYVTHRVCRKAAPYVNGHGKASYRPWVKTWPACGLFVAVDS